MILNVQAKEGGEGGGTPSAAGGNLLEFPIGNAPAVTRQRPRQIPSMQIRMGKIRMGKIRMGKIRMAKIRMAKIQ